MKIEERLKVVYETVSPLITRSVSAWTDYLKFAARVYKYPFDNAILIFAQNPSATMLATMLVWNKVGRYINKGEKGIPVCEYNNARATVRYLFDVKQTNGKSIPEVWELDDYRTSELVKRLSYSHGIKSQNLNDCISQIVDKTLTESFDEHLFDIENRVRDINSDETINKEISEIITQSCKYFIAERCGTPMGELNVSGITRFNTIPIIAKLGSTVTELSKNVLIEIERNVKIISNERSNINGTENSGNVERQELKLDTKGTFDEQGTTGTLSAIATGEPRTIRGGRTAREIRQNGSQILGGQQTFDNLDTQNGGQADGNDESDRNGGEKETGGAYTKLSEQRPDSGNGRYTGKNPALQQEESYSGGNRTKRNSADTEINDIEGELEDSPSSGISDYTEPFVVINSSESSAFAKNEHLSFTEADLKFKEVEKLERQERIERYGKQYGYNKTWGKIYYLDNESDTELSVYEFRYDIGDYEENQSGLFNHVSSFLAYMERAFEKGEKIINNNDDIVATKRMIDLLKPYQDTSFLPKAEIKSSQNKSNYRYSESDNIYMGGAKSKFKANIEAIKLLQRIESEKRLATPDEQKILANYVGWGGLANAFSKTASGWENEYQELKLLLNDDEYKSAMNSTITAYYTEPKLIEHIYKALDNFGFEGGANRKILDPAMGTGNFFSIIPENLKETKLYGVELDIVTGRIAKQLYQNADISVQGFETTNFDDNSFDVAIGNIPFNNIKLYDRRYEEEDFMIHDYFIAKSLDLIKPGGIIVYITSKGTMDKHDTSVREYIAERADFIGAVRLPNTAFKQLAGTEVTADIIFLQKRSEKLEINKLPSNEIPDWIYSNTKRTDFMQLNSYFIDNPDMILGKMVFSRAMYGNENGTACIAPTGYDLYAELGRAVNKLSATFTAEPDKPKKVTEQYDDVIGEDNAELLKAPDGTKNNTYVIHENDIFYCENGWLLPQDLKGKKAERIKGLCEIRTALNEVIAIQLHEYQFNDLANAQKRLNDVYDTFVSKNGYINNKPNVSAFSEDDQLPLLLSIEDLNADNTTYSKAPIFTKATIKSYTRPTNAESAKEALEISLNYKMKVDLKYMSELCNKDEDEIIAELGDRIYINPQKYYGNPYECWETAEEYLSGDVVAKLAYAKLKCEENPMFERNVSALEEVQPPLLMPSEISFRIGSPWIPKEYFAEFMYETFETSKTLRGLIELDYFEYTTQWRIANKLIDSSIKVDQTYGTKRVNAYEIFEDCLNLQSTTVRDPQQYLDKDGKEKTRYVVNAAETMIARAKQQQIKEAFAQWLFMDKDRAETLLKIYNNTFNTIRPREYNGSHLTFANMNEEMELNQHQKNVVARIIYNGTCLMAHDVGAGKTAAMIAAGMYMKNIGAISKPIYVVPNHLTEQWATEFMRFYPSANILVTTKKDFEKNNRKKFISKIAMGEYDGVIIGHSQFEKIPISRERQERQLNEEISSLSYAIGELKRKKGENWAVKQIVIFQNRLKTRLENLIKDGRKDDLLTFEQLGVDYMFVDEAHAFKNCATYSKMRNVAGIGKSSSQRASDMLMKCQYLQEKYNGKGVTFATGTPISNSMSEMYVMQRFLQPNILKKMGLNYFDSWAATFGEVVQSLEITPEGSSYHIKNRFSKFYNLPELMNTFKLVADIQTSEMLNLPVPKIKGGKAEVCVTECSDFQKQIMQGYVDRAENIRKRKVSPEEDNMLKLTSEAKLMAIDPRLVYENAPGDHDSKLNNCINNVFGIWEKTADKRLTQVIFCDSGVPKPGKFNVYDEVKTRLIKMGVPDKEIAFVHDAKTDSQRDVMFDKVRKGEIRVLLGSTGKLGTGTNIQTKLFALHHLDVPWRPDDIIQRDGRGVRPFNENPEIEIYRYVTRNTFDSYLWQIQEQKLGFISQIMTGKSIARSCDDIDETVLCAAEIKALATGNPLLAEKMEVDNEVARLKLLRGNWNNERLTLERHISEKYPDTIAKCEKMIEAELEDIAMLEKTKSEDFAITIDGTIYNERAKAGEIIATILKAKCEIGGDSVQIGEYRGFKIHVLRKSITDSKIQLRGNGQYTTSLGESGLGCISRIENLTKKIPTFLEENKQLLEKTVLQLAEAKKNVVKPFDFEERLNEYIARQSDINTKLEYNELSKQESVILDESNDVGNNEDDDNVDDVEDFIEDEEER